MSRRRRTPAQRPVATRLRVADPTDLLAVLPFLLGFHPQESVVTVLVRGGRVALTARVDLPAAADAVHLGRELAVLADRQQADELVLVAYSARREPALAVLDRLVEFLGALASDAVYVDGRRWWSRLCTAACCPPEGRPYEIESHPLAAEAVLAGLPVRATRAELQASLVGPDPADYSRLEQQGHRLRAELGRLGPVAAAELMETTVRTAVLGAADLDETGRLRLAALATDLRLRDRAWALIDREAVDQHLRLWSAVVQSAPPSLAPAPLCLLGLAGWIGGDGALLNCCAERVATLDPGYSLGGLLADISARAVPPSLWDEMQAGLCDELGLVAG